ncbi:MAG: hypothetical protein A2173_05395 [Planctomycetes bacterium RBG_13_44_8b]|nr:MAG: hypothetical protein A2173_05395 [Planctomycetes bacterium RBG_13_44_8b]
MKAIRSILAVAGLISLLVLLPKTASARVHFRISIGTPVFHHYPGFYPGYYPYHIRHRGHGFWGPSHFYGHRPFYSSGVGFGVGDCRAVFIGTPVVVEVPTVITKRQVVVNTQQCNCNPGYDGDTQKLYEKLRSKKTELLETLKIGSKENRKKAISELAGFTFDDKVRGALENVLLSDSDPQLRKEVAISFEDTGNKKVLPALEYAEAEDPSREVRQAAYRAIIMIKGY